MSALWLRRISIILAILGLGVAGYLTWAYYVHANIICLTGNQCDAVRNSPYSEIQGMPVALVGLLGYLAILAVLVSEETSMGAAIPAPMIVFGLSLVGLLYSGYLTYLELFVINAICSWCVVSAVLMLIIFIIAVVRVTRSVEA